MLSFNGSTGVLGASISPLGVFAGYLLLNSGNYWIAVLFLGLTGMYFFMAFTTLIRYVLNARRYNPELEYLTYPIRSAGDPVSSRVVH